MGYEPGIALMMDTVESRARILKALSDPTRLRIFEYLCACSGTVSVEESGEVRQVSGASVGEVCCSVTDVCASSTVSHHLKELRNAGVIAMSRQGKNMICAAVPGAVELLATYFGSLAGTNESESAAELVECR